MLQVEEILDRCAEMIVRVVDGVDAEKCYVQV
jgi:hypothetical protein